MNKPKKKAPHFEAAKEIVEEFQEMLGLAELKALSKVSLERQLSDKEFEKFMRLKKEVLGGTKT